jgi:hypothetical protein
MISSLLQAAISSAVLLRDNYEVYSEKRIKGVWEEAVVDDF